MLSKAVKAKEELPITRWQEQPETRSKYSQKALVVWCPWCGRSRKDPSGPLQGIPAFRCQCGAEFVE